MVLFFRVLGRKTSIISGLIVVSSIVGGWFAFAGGLTALLVYLVASVLIWGTLAGIVWHYIYGPIFTVNRIMQTGEDGTAKIISITQGEPPHIRLTLHVQPASGKSSYQATLDTFVSAVESMQYQFGSKLEIKIDPKNPQSFALVGQPEVSQRYSTIFRSVW